MGLVNTNLLWMIAGTLAALSIGTAIRLAALRHSTAEVVKQRLGSLKVWWILALLWSTAAMFGQIGAAVLLATASFLALREYLRLLGTKEQIGNAVIAGMLVCGVCHYALIVGGASEVAKWFLPIVALISFSAIRATLGNCEGYIRITGGLYWGAMLMIYALSYSLFLFDIDAETEPVVGPAGWFLYLVLLTEMNDIMQAIVGRKFGKQKITPQVSPHKSLEGLVGGLVSTAILAIVLAPWLTTMMVGREPWLGILLSGSAGLLISIVGFLGDLNMSAIKRDAGVKDGSSLLPGMGGVIDRIDSLSFTGPAFYYWVILLKLPHSLG
jgi:phosphatidate cytidylyltransferase